MKLEYLIFLIGFNIIGVGTLMGQSNEGKEFWLGFMEHRDVGANTMVVMITSRVNTTGTVSMPGQSFSRNFTVGANEVVVIDNIPRIAETVGSEFINNNAIRITAENDISVYMHQYFLNRSEASVVLPKSSIGNSYYVISYTGVPSGATFGGGGPYPSEFLIVANEDETNIEYTLSGATQNGKAPNTTHQITLDAGQVYQVRADGPLIDLTGTFITGDKAFTLFAGTSWSQVPIGCTAMDNLLEQMYPISTWGMRYVASPFIKTNNDLYRVIASEDNTVVRIESSSIENITIDAGEYYDFQSGKGAFIEGSKPISVAQFITGSGCNGGIGDPSMVVLNTVEQIRDTVTLFNSRFQEIIENYINVICKEGEEDLIFIDDQNLIATGISFTPIGSNGQFLFATIPTTNGAHTLYTEGCGIVAMAYGYGNLESYAYSGGASFAKINENPIPEGGCLNDTILFDTGLPEERFAVFWDLGDGTTSDEHEFEHLYSSLDTFDLSVIIEDLCFDQIDTIYRELKVTLRQDITAFEDQFGCEGTTVHLGAFDLSGASFEWTGPNDYIADEQFPSIENMSIDGAGLYEVVGNISGCKTIPKDIMVEVYKNPEPDLGIDTVLCTIDGDRYTLKGGPYESFLWQDGSHETTLVVSEEGTFSLEVSDINACIGRDTITIMRQCPTRFYIPNAFSPNGDGINDFFGVSGIEIITMELLLYDRWGQLLFSANDPSEHWDGTFEDQEVMNGEYIWVMSYMGYLADASIFSDQETGTVLVIR